MLLYINCYFWGGFCRILGELLSRWHPPAHYVLHTGHYALSPTHYTHAFNTSTIKCKGCNINFPVETH